MKEESRLLPDNFNDYSWTQLIRSIVNYTALPGENIDDIVVGCWEIGQNRANLLGRHLEVWQDIPYALSIFCWWPFKPSLYEGNRDYLLKYRKAIFDGFARDPSEKREIILKIIPEKTLCMEMQKLFFYLTEKPISEILESEYILQNFNQD